jgi:hypothetical protein
MPRRGCDPSLTLRLRLGHVLRVNLLLSHVKAMNLDGVVLPGRRLRRIISAVANYNTPGDKAIGFNCGPIGFGRD